MTNLPPWLTKGAIAHHIPTKTCFIVEQLRRDRTTGRVVLLDAPSGSVGDCYPLEECEAATLGHFNGCALLCTRGKAVSVTRQGSFYCFSNGEKVGRVMVDDVAAAAASMAKFFGGEVMSCP